MSAELTSTDVSATPTADSTALAPSPGGDLGNVVDSAAAQLGSDQLATGTWETGLPEVDEVIQAIPADDNDLKDQLEQRHAQSLIQTRGQLRVLSKALRDAHNAKKAYSELGELDSIKPQLELANLLFSPVVDPATNKPVYDPETQTPYVDPRPFVEYLDEYSPGMPEQLLATLLEYRTQVGVDPSTNRPIMDTLANQVFRQWGLDPRRLVDYQNIDKLAPVSSAVTATELEEIPKEFHEAYKSIPPSIRNAWAAYDEPDQLRMLHDYKDQQASKEFQHRVEERDKQQAAMDTARFQAAVAMEQGKYFETVRRERFGAIANSLNSQVKFSDDPATNTIMHGAVGAVLASLIDPELRFVSEPALKALGITLDHTFDEALDKFNSNANDKVALEMSGDTVRAGKAQNDAKNAADQVAAKLTTIALKLVTKMGGQMATAAKAQGNALASANAVRPTSGNGSAPNLSQGVLPAGVSPGSPEARRFWAESFPGV